MWSNIDYSEIIEINGSIEVDKLKGFSYELALMLPMNSGKMYLERQYTNILNT